MSKAKGDRKDADNGTSILSTRNHKGKSLRKIAEETGHDFQTVKKYVEKDDFNSTLGKATKKGKLISAFHAALRLLHKLLQP